MPYVPQRADLIIQNYADLRFDVVDLQGGMVAGPFTTLADAVSRVRFQVGDKISIWQQRVDANWQSLSPPMMLLPRRGLSVTT